MRHNISLIADACKSDLDGLAREAKALQERKKFVISEDARLRKKIEDEAELISRLQQIHIVANDINDMTKTLLSTYEVSLDPFSPVTSQAANVLRRIIHLCLCHSSVPMPIVCRRRLRP